MDMRTIETETGKHKEAFELFASAKTGFKTLRSLYESTLRSLVSEASRFASLNLSKPGRSLLELTKPFTVHRSPFTVHRSPFAVRRSPFTVRRSPFAVHRSPFTVHRSPFTVRRSPFAVHRSPFTVHRSPFAVHRSPFAVHRRSQDIGNTYGSAPSLKDRFRGNQRSQGSVIRVSHQFLTDCRVLGVCRVLLFPVSVSIVRISIARHTKKRSNSLRP